MEIKGTTSRALTKPSRGQKGLGRGPLSDLTSIFNNAPLNRSASRDDNSKRYPRGGCELAKDTSLSNKYRIRSVNATCHAQATVRAQPGLKLSPERVEELARFSQPLRV
jgi:hypothetical protein